jgi:hypothetical protein
MSSARIGLVVRSNSSNFTVIFQGTGHQLSKKNTVRNLSYVLILNIRNTHAIQTSNGEYILFSLDTPIIVSICVSRMCCQKSLRQILLGSVV